MAKQREAVSGTNFKKKVSAIVRSGKSIRGNVQECTQYAMVSYLDPENNGNTGDLSFLIAAVAGVKSLNSKLLGQYIEDTVNVTLSKTSEGTLVFKKAVKGSTPAILENGNPDAPWWEHGRDIEIKVLDAIKSLESLVKSLEGSISGDVKKRPIEPTQACVVDDLIARVTDLKTWTANTVSIRNAANAAEDGTVIQEIAAA